MTPERLAELTNKVEYLKADDVLAVLQAERKYWEGDDENAPADGNSLAIGAIGAVSNCLVTLAGIPGSTRHPRVERKVLVSDQEISEAISQLMAVAGELFRCDGIPDQDMPETMPCSTMRVQIIRRDQIRRAQKIADAVSVLRRQ